MDIAAHSLDRHLNSYSRSYLRNGNGVLTVLQFKNAG